MLKKINNYLKEEKYKYDTLEHKTTYTAWDRSQTTKIKPQEIAKALVLTVDREKVLALIPSHKNLDKKKFLKVYNAKRKKEDLKCAKKVDLTKEAWMKKNIPGEIGATPPFSKLLNLPIYMDRALTKGTKVYLGSGEYETSLVINTKQYLKKEDPVLGSFSAVKKIKKAKKTKGKRKEKKK